MRLIYSVLYSVLCLAFTSAVQANDLSKRHGAAAQCATHFVEWPSRSIGAHSVTVMRQSATRGELDQTLVVSFLDGGSMRAEFFHAAGRSYYDQCLAYFEQHTTALDDPTQAIRAMDAPKQDRHLLNSQNCAALHRDFTALPGILESNAAALRREIGAPDSSTANSRLLETVIVRADGPSYRLRLRARSMDTIDLRPAVESALELLIEGMLDHAEKCTSALRAATLLGVERLRPDPTRHSLSFANSAPANNRPLGKCDRV
jgi:hypothetical protein